MSYRTIKWIIFTALFLTVPAMLFLIQVVMFMPAVFMVAGIFYMIPKTLNPANFGETLAFVTIFGVHVLIYSGIYYFLSFLLAKLIALVKSDNARKLLVTAVCFSLLGITFMPLYGGGGHGPVKLAPLPQYLSEINSSYGSAASAVVYGSVLLLVILKLLIKRHSCRKRLVLS